MIEFSKNAYRLLQLFDQMRDRRLGTTFQRLSDLHLSFTHLRALRLLTITDAMAMKDLAEQLYLTPPSVTALTRRLVQTGLIRREAHAEDSRVALLSLTAAGHDLLQEISHDQLGQMELLLRGLTSEEQEQFLGLMERAVRAIRACHECSPEAKGLLTNKKSSVGD
jgi:DNA-binding MarR family transcriptional regulator